MYVIVLERSKEGDERIVAYELGDNPEEVASYYLNECNAIMKSDG